MVADQDARALVCDERGPRVCVTRAHADFLPTLTAPAREALALMEKLPNPPTSVVELAPNEDAVPPAGTTPVYFPMWLPTDPAKIRLTVLVGGDSPTCDTNDWDAVTRIGAARIIVASWLTGELAPMPNLLEVWQTARKEIDRSWQALQELPPAEQAARVAALREAAVFCRGEVTL